MPTPASIVEVASLPLKPIGLPATSIRLELGEGKKAFVFTMARSAREAMTPEAFSNLAQSLGDLCFPSNAALVVLPDESELSAYVVEAE